MTRARGRHSNQGTRPVRKGCEVATNTAQETLIDLEVELLGGSQVEGARDDVDNAVRQAKLTRASVRNGKSVKHQTRSHRLAEVLRILNHMIHHLP